MKLSVWLVPAERDAALLSAAIGRCASAFGSPTFPPHITICSEPADTALAGLGPELPLQIAFGDVAFGSDYFHACYLSLQDDARLRALQARCAAALRGGVPEKYPPHLSLAYGALSEAQRALVASLVPARLQAEFDRLQVWDTSGSVSNWRQLAGA